MKIKVYAGYYELYITDKEMPYGFSLLEEFGSVTDAEGYAESYEDWIWLDRDLIGESSYSIDEDSDDYIDHTFDYKELVVNAL